jgi:hypothetical protein
MGNVKVGVLTIATIHVIRSGFAYELDNGKIVGCRAYRTKVRVAARVE